MKVVVNGTPREVPEGTTLADLIPRVAADLQPRGVAVARNGEVVPRRAWADTPLSDGDRVEIVGAVQGG